MFVHTVLVAASFTLTTPAPVARLDVSKHNSPTYYTYSMPRSPQQPDTGKKEPKRKPPPPPPPPPKPHKVEPKAPPPKQTPPPPPKGQPELRRRKP